MKTLAAVMSVLLFASPVSAQSKNKANTSTSVSVPGLGCSSDSFGANAWSWGASNSGTFGGGGSGSGAVNVQDLFISRSSDACSPKLIAAVTTGRHFKVLNLAQYSADGVLAATLTLEDVLFSSFQISSATGQNGVAENVSVAFRRFCLTDEATSASACYAIP